MDMYTRKKHVAQHIAIAGKSDRRIATPTGIVVGRKVGIH
jgi:hypothetical protein